MKTLIFLTITALWTAAGAAIFALQFDLQKPTPPNEIGDFLAGLFSPVAFLWLVVGYFQQGKELKQNTKALELQANELKLSVGQQRELVAVTQADLALSREAYERESIPQEKISGSLISIGIGENHLDQEFCYTLCNTGNVQFAIKEAAILLNEHAIDAETNDLPLILKPGEVRIISLIHKKELASLPDAEGVEFALFSAKGNSYRLNHDHLGKTNIWDVFELNKHHLGY